MSHRLEIGLALLLATAIGVALWAANRKPDRQHDLDPRASTFLTGPSGSKALHEVLSRMGRLSERRRTPLLNLANERAHRPAVLVLLSPIIGLQEQQVEQVDRDGRAGGGDVARGW